MYMSSETALNSNRCLFWIRAQIFVLHIFIKMPCQKVSPKLNTSIEMESKINVSFEISTFNKLQDVYTNIHKNCQKLECFFIWFNKKCQHVRHIRKNTCTPHHGKSIERPVLCMNKHLLTTIYTAMWVNKYVTSGQTFMCTTSRKSIERPFLQRYSSPSILRPLTRPRVYGLILQVVLKGRSFSTEWHFGAKSSGLIIKGGLKIKGCKIEGPLYIFTYHHFPHWKV